MVVAGRHIDVTVCIAEIHFLLLVYQIQIVGVAILRGHVVMVRRLLEPSIVLVVDFAGGTAAAHSLRGRLSSGRGHRGRRALLKMQVRIHLLLLVSLLTVLLQPLQDFRALLLGHRLYHKVIVAALQRVVRMVGTVPVGVREPHLTALRRTDEWTFARVQALVRFQLTALCEGTRASRIVARVGTFA